MTDLMIGLNKGSARGKKGMVECDSTISGHTLDLKKKFKKKNRSLYEMERLGFADR
jgi:hypothetical protein